MDAAAAGEDDRATWAAFLLAYLSPSEDEQPFAGTEAVLAAAPSPAELPPTSARCSTRCRAGPAARTGRAAGRVRSWPTLQRAERAGGQQAAFSGDAGWTPERRFARVFERLALPGLHRGARYELLVVLGRLGVQDLRADSLHLGTGRGAVAGEDEAALAAKRVFGIGDPLLLDRRAGALADAAGVPLEALDLALYNWSQPADGERATLGFSPGGTLDAAAAAAALGV